MKPLAPLNSVTDMGDCADAFVMLAKNGPIIFHFFFGSFLGNIVDASLTIDAGLSLMARNKREADWLQCENVLDAV